MDLNAIGIPIAFILLAAIGLWLLIFAKGWWILKIFFMTLCLYFSIAVWLSLSQLSGWPSSSVLPEKFLINGIAVQEPSLTNPNDKGNIYIWATELDNDFKAKKTEISSWLMPFVSKKRPSEPRAYRLPYTDEMKEQLSQVSKMMKAGKPVVGERNKLTGKGEGEGDGQGKGQGGKGQGGNGKGQGQGKGKGGSMSQEQDFMFYELPPPKFPEK
jgi:hypothetical protein